MTEPEMERASERWRAGFDTPHGRCVIVELVDDAAVTAAVSALPVEEQAIAATLPSVRRRELVAGRTALHAALGEVATAVAVLADDRGAPQLPAGWSGSISHKGTRAAALVARAQAGTIGVDLERAEPPRLDIGRRVLTAREQAVLAARALDADAHGRAVTLRFAIKEAIYKAIDPWVRRYVGFTEVELEVGAAGVPCGVHVVDAARLPLVIEATWRELDGFWLATACARAT